MGRKTNSVSLRLKKTNKDYNHCWYGDILYSYNFNRSLNIQKIFHDTFQSINIPCPKFSLAFGYKKTKGLLCYLDPVRRKFLSENLSLKIRENYTNSFTLIPEKKRYEKPMFDVPVFHQKSKGSNNVYVNKINIWPLYRKNDRVQKLYTNIYERAKIANKGLYNGRVYNHKGTYGVTFLKCGGEVVYKNSSTHCLSKSDGFFQKKPSARAYSNCLQTYFHKNENIEGEGIYNLHPSQSSVYTCMIYILYLYIFFSQKYAQYSISANPGVIKQDTGWEKKRHMQKFAYLYKYGFFLAFACFHKSISSIYGKKLTYILEEMFDLFSDKYTCMYQQPSRLWHYNAARFTSKNVDLASPLDQWCSSINSWGNGVSIYILKYTNEKACALFLADVVRYLLERKVLFRRIKRQILQILSSGLGFSCLNLNHKHAYGKGKGCCYKYAGVRIVCSGRVGGRSKKAQRSRKEIFMWGETGLHVFSSKLDFAKTYAETSFGTIGIKVWVCYK